MTILLRGLITLTCILIAGCASNNVGKNYLLDSGSGKGLLIGSLVQEGHLTSNSLFFREIGINKNKSRISMNRMFLPKGIYGSDFEDSEGKLFVVELDEGQYEFYSWMMHSGSWSIEPDSDFSRKFEIKSGEATYVGEYRLKNIMGKNLFGVSIVSGASLIVDDKYSRDFPLLSSKINTARLDKINMSIDTETISKQDF